MKINHDPFYIEFKVLTISFRNDWYAIWQQWRKLSKFNWLNFSPISIEFERSYYLGKYADLTIVIMGLGVSFSWNWSTDEDRAQLMKELKLDE